MSGAHGEDSIDRAVAAGGTPQAPSSSAGVQSGADVRPTRAQVWLARSAFGAAFAAVAVLVGFAGLRSLSMVLVGVVGVVVFVAAAYWFLARRGVLRWAAAVVAVAAPIVVLVLYLRAQLLWVALLSLAFAVLAGVAGRAALSVVTRDQSMPTYPARPVKHPFLVMNPRSGGGKVTKFGLKEKAEALGAEVALLEGPGTVDVGRPGPGRRWPTAPTCSAWPAGTAPRRWSPASPPSTTCRSWSSAPAPATTSRWTSGWTGRTRPTASTASPTGGAAGGPRRHQRSHVRQQRLVRRLRRDRAEPGVPGRQGRHHAEHAARPARRPHRGPRLVVHASRRHGRRAAGGAGEQRRRTRWATSPGSAAGPGSTTASSASSWSPSTPPGRRSACCAADTARPDHAHRRRGRRRRRRARDRGRGRRRGDRAAHAGALHRAAEVHCGYGCRGTVPGCLRRDR